MAMIEKTERFVNMLSKAEGFVEKLPRLLEMGGVAMFAGRASERLGGRFIDGVVGGIVADGLAHSQLPNNQIGGLALAAYFTSIGLLNMLPYGEPTLKFDPDDPVLTGAGGTTIDPANVYSGLEPLEAIMSHQECLAVGGSIVRPVPQTGLVVCALPPPPPAPPHENDLPVRPIRGPQR